MHPCVYVCTHATLCMLMHTYIRIIFFICNVKLIANKLHQNVNTWNPRSQEKIYKLKLSVVFLSKVGIFTDCQNWDRSVRKAAGNGQHDWV